MGLALHSSLMGVSGLHGRDAILEMNGNDACIKPLSCNKGLDGCYCTAKSSGGLRGMDPGDDLALLLLPYLPLPLFAVSGPAAAPDRISNLLRLTRRDDASEEGFTYIERRRAK